VSVCRLEGLEDGQVIKRIIGNEKMKLEKEQQMSYEYPDGTIRHYYGVTHVNEVDGYHHLKMLHNQGAIIAPGWRSVFIHIHE
jgi:hypothetical protein